MKVLVIGSGGREHALAWKLKQSSRVEQIFIAPGNAGTSSVGKNIPCSTLVEILNWLNDNPVDLVIVGPDDFLADGAVDQISEKGISVFGPTRDAAQIEWSKAFAKQFMEEEEIPTARYAVCSTIDAAREYVRGQSFPLVIKASGLAMGKGVVIVQSLVEAEKLLEEIMTEGLFGNAGNEVVIEEFLVGREISTHAFCDGEHVTMFPATQDHKRAYDGDQGPNTGGMGTIAPVPGVTEQELEQIKRVIVLPTVQALKKRGRPFKGVLFPGVMLTKDGPKVIEFNARFGDPETQSYMRLLETDLLDIVFACIDGTLSNQQIDWKRDSACCVVLASGGYPGRHEKGLEIHGLSDVESEAVIFHAGTKMVDGSCVTNGGRVLGVTTTGGDLLQALEKAYKSIEKISFSGMEYRRDIGAKSLDQDPNRR